jgi:acetyl-CoA synthetase
MTGVTRRSSPADRVAAALARWSDPAANAAWLLCDRHPGAAVAFTVLDGDERADHTYDELRERSGRCAETLRDLGVRPGDRVATLMGKGFDLVVVMLGIWRLGAVYVPLFTAFAPAAIGERLRRSAAVALVTEPGPHADLAREAAEATPCRVVVAGPTGDGEGNGSGATGDGPAPPPVAVGGGGAFVHLFTSGTTGSPKGVVHPLAFMAGWDVYLEYAMGVTGDDVYWCAADPGWGYGLYAAVLAPLSLAVHAVLVRGGFDVATTYRTLTTLGVTTFAAAPTAFRAMRAGPPPSDRPAPTRLSSAGEPLTSEINRWTADALGAEVRDHYGQTEVGMIAAQHHHHDLARPLRSGSMGTESPGWRLTVLRADQDVPAAAGEVGRLAVDTSASPLMTFAGYHDDPVSDRERFSADGRWYLTGDAASRDVTGELFFSARDDDVIITAGYRVGPYDVESVIGGHPAVAECAVVAGPDPIRGEIIEAFVVPCDTVTDEAALAADLQETVRTRYGAHAYPRRVHLRSELPKTPSGKIQRYALRAECAAMARDR